MPEPNIVFADGYAKPVNTNDDQYSNDALARWIDQKVAEHGKVTEINVPGFDASNERYRNLFDLQPVDDNPRHLAKTVRLKAPLAPEFTAMDTTPLAASTFLRTAGPELGELGGAIGGAAIGGVAGAPGLGATAGAGAGRAGGAKAADMYGKSLGLPMPDTDYAKEGLTGMLWEGGMRGAGDLIKSAWRWSGRAGRPTAETAEVLRRMENVGVSPHRWQLSQTGATATLFNYAMNSPVTARKISDSLISQIDETMAGLEKRLAVEIPGGGTALPDIRDTARMTDKAFTDIAKRRRGWKIKAGSKYAKAEAFLPEGGTQRAMNTMNGLFKLSDEMRDVLDAGVLPPQARRVLVGLTTEGKAGRISVPGGGSVTAPMPISDLHKIRTMVREAKGNISKLDGKYNQRQQSLDKLEKLLTEDIYDGYKRYGGDDGLNAIKKADQFWAANREIDKKYIKQVATKAGFDSPLDLHRAIERKITGLDTDAVAVIRGRLGSDSQEWEKVVSQYIKDRVITGRGNIDFSAFTKMRDEIGKSKQLEGMLFGKSGSAQRQYWDDLTKYFEENAKILERASKPLASREGAGILTNVRLSGPAAALGLGGATFATTGSPTASAAVALGLMTMTPNAAWALIKQPKVMKVFMDKPQQGIAYLPARVAQLGRIERGLDEDERAALLEFFGVMESAFGGGADTRKQSGHPLAGGAFGGR